MLKQYLNRLVEVQTKDQDGKKFFFHGFLTGIDSEFIKLEDMKDGEMLIKKQNIHLLKNLKPMKVNELLMKLDRIEDRLFSESKFFHMLKRSDHEYKILKKHGYKGE